VPLSIGQLAKIANVTNRTLRYYEELGLINPSTRGQNGYRYYESTHLKRLQTIKLLQESGLELKEIAGAISPQLDPSGQITYRGQQLAEKVSLALQTQKSKILQKQKLLNRALEGLDETLTELETCFGCTFSHCISDCESCPNSGAQEIISISQKWNKKRPENQA